MSDNENQPLITRGISLNDNPKPPNHHISVLQRIPQVTHLILFVTSLCFIAPVILVRKYPDLDVFVLTAFRNAVVCILALPRLIYFRINPEPEGRRWKLAIRAMFSAFYTMTIYTSFRYMPLGDSRMITALQPILVASLACILLKEDCSTLTVGAICLSVVGSLIALNPPILFAPPDASYFNKHYLLAFALTFLGTAFQAGGLVSARTIKEVDVCVVLLWNGLFGIFPLP